MTTDTSVNRETKAIAGFLRSTPARVIKVAVLLAILLFVPPLIDNPYVTRIFISAMMLGVMAAIYDLMIGYAGLVNFGSAEERRGGKECVRTCRYGGSTD